MEDGAVPKTFVVRLSPEEREQLLALVKAGKAAALKLVRARVLLKADQQERRPAWTDVEIAEALEVSLKTVFNIRRRWVEHGLEAALERKPPDAPAKPRKLDGNVEAKLVATCCGPPPKGRAKWTLRLLAAKLVELAAVDSISPETVRQALKKMRSSPG
jgi:transposase